MNKVGINAITNILARIWSMISIYIFVPLYITILGETTYGLVSFFATLQTAFNILGLGLTNTLRREFAVGDTSEENIIRKYKLLRSIEILYLMIAFFIFFICSAFSLKIATDWLNIEMLDPIMVSNVISLMGLSIAVQLVANLYAGCLFGLNYQMLANNSCIIWSAAKYIGSLIIIWAKPDLIAFYSWHIVCDFSYCLFLRYKTVQKLQVCKSKKRWTPKDITCIKNIWKYTAGVLFISFVALINKQFDKVIISNNLTLTELGAYNIATTLGNLTSIIPTALYTSVFPIFTKYATTGEEDKLKRVFSDFSRVINIILSCMIAFIAVFSEELILGWTGSDNYSNVLGISGALVVIAVGVIEYQELPYALALSHGNTKYNIAVGGIAIPFTFIVTLYGIQNYGLLGAGYSSMVLMAFQTIIYLTLVYKKYVYSRPNIHLLTGVITPLALSIVVAYFCKLVINLYSMSNWHIIISAVICGATTLTIELILFAKKELFATLKYLKEG